MQNDCLHLESGNSEVGPRSSQKAEAAHKVTDEARERAREAALLHGIPNEVPHTPLWSEDIVHPFHLDTTTHDLCLTSPDEWKDSIQDHSSWLSAALLELEAPDAAVAPSVERLELSDWNGEDFHGSFEELIAPEQTYDWTQLAMQGSLDIITPVSSSNTSDQTEEGSVGNDRHCLECDKDFKYPKDFRRHIRSVHNDERPYKCPVNRCKYQVKGFSREDNRKRHMSRMHPGIAHNTDVTYEL